MGCMNCKHLSRHSTLGIQSTPPTPVISTNQAAIQKLSMQIAETVAAKNESMVHTNAMQSIRIPFTEVEDDKFQFVSLAAYHTMKEEELSFDKGERLRVSIFYHS